MKESNIQRLIMMELTRQGVTIFSNPSGNGVAGAQMKRIETAGPVNLVPGDWVVRHGSRIQYGLTVGSSDLIGWRPMTVTPDMLGRVVAVFCAVEVKTPSGVATDDQKRFLTAVRNAGGVAGIVRSPEDIDPLLNPLFNDKK